MMNSYKEMTPIQGDHLKSVYSQGFHAFLKAFKLDNNPGNYFPIALSNHSETRNKLDQRFVYNVELKLILKKKKLYKWQRCSLRKIVIPIEIKSFLEPTMIQTMNQFKNEN